jgi:uncharacterized RDD family membrane protein YckC
VTEPGARDDQEPDGLAVFDGQPPAPGEEPRDSADPEPAAGDLPIAHPAMRAFAFLLDGLATFLVVVVVVLAGLSGSSWDVFWAIPLVPLLAALLDTVLTALRGVSPAKAILGIRVVDVASGAPIGFARAGLRSLVIVAPVVVAYAAAWILDRLQAYDAALIVPLALPIALWVGLLALLAMRPRHRGLQDLAGRSVVLRVR